MYKEPFLNDNYSINIDVPNGISLSYYNKTKTGFNLRFHEESPDDFRGYPLTVNWVAQEYMMDINFILIENPWTCKISFKINNEDSHILTTDKRFIAEKEFSRWLKSSSNKKTKNAILKNCSPAEARNIWLSLISQGWFPLKNSV